MPQQRICALPADLATRIAAGEAVNRPASAIKELIENSIDAGATQIKLSINKGGIDRIEIEDNGRGIHRDDLLLAVSRHCTSKIRSDDDLLKVQTMGFRGEALASISAVSRLTITSKHEDSDAAFSLSCNGFGQNDGVMPAALQQGTKITMRELFFNVPARRKFLRSPKTEARQVLNVVGQIALSQPQLAIRFTEDNKLRLNIPSASTESEALARVGKVIGDGFTKHAHNIAMTHHGLSLRGWIAHPSFERSQADMQYFYINGRYVQDKVVRHAIRAAYDDVLFHGRHPCYVLFFDIPPQSVDVNVHPNKHEVRFRDHALVHSFLKECVSQAISQLPMQQSATPVIDTDEQRQALQETIQKAKENHAQYQESQPKTRLTTAGTRNTYQPSLASATAAKPAPKASHASSAQTAVIQRPLTDTATETSQQATAPIAHKKIALAQLHDLYILAQDEQGLVIVEMHAAHERILFEKLKKQLANDGIKTQKLLLPIQLELTSNEMRCWEDHHSALTQCGLVSDKISATTIALTELPSIIPEKSCEKIFRSLLEQDTDSARSADFENKCHAILGNIACKSAIKANHSLSLMAMQAILDDMETTPRCGLCNHGRPSIMHIDIATLDKFFLRGQ